MYTMTNEAKELEKQAVVCLRFGADPNKVADARKWHGSVRAAFLRAVREKHNKKLHETFNRNRGY